MSIIRRIPALSTASAAGLGAALLVFVLAACGSSDGSPVVAKTTFDDGKPTVLATFTVIADIARNVGGDTVDVQSITKPGAEIHGYEPTPSDITKAARADLVLDNGLGLERWFQGFLRTSHAKHVTVSTGVTPIPIAGASEYAGKPNPHSWMSVANALIYVENIRRALTDLDPGNAAMFAANAERYSAKLVAVRDDVRRELAGLPADRRALVTCEGAFSYMAHDFGLQEGYLWPVNAEQEGTPQQIASTITFVRSHRVPAVFCESTVNDKAQKEVARETGARFGGVLYVDSLSDADGPVPTYERLLRRDADTIVAGLTDKRVPQ